MAIDLDQFTDKAQATVQAAVQLAKDYANSQGGSFVDVPRTNPERSFTPLYVQYTPHTLVPYS